MAGRQVKYSRKVHTKLNPNVEDTLLNLVLISYVWKEADTAFWEKSDEPILPLKSQTLEDVIDTWPQGNIDVRIGDYMFAPTRSGQLLLYLMPADI